MERKKKEIMKKRKHPSKNRKGSMHIIDSNALHNNSELVYEGTACILLIAKGVRNDSFDLRLLSVISGWVYTSQLVHEGTKFSHYSEGFALVHHSVIDCGC